MLYTPFQFIAALALLVMGLFPFNGHGQAPAGIDDTVVLHVKGLTSSSRDALSRELASGSGLQLVYVCVPAGILALRPEPGSSTALLRQSATRAVERHARPKDISELSVSREQAEELCAQARNH